MKNTTLPSACQMLKRALDPAEKCVIVVTAEGFTAVPENIHRPRPTALILRPVSFVKEIHDRTKRPLAVILASADPDAILQSIAKAIFREKGNPPASFIEGWRRIW